MSVFSKVASALYMVIAVISGYELYNWFGWRGLVLGCLIGVCTVSAAIQLIPSDEEQEDD